jgi:hypothetical protein
VRVSELAKPRHLAAPEQTGIARTPGGEMAMSASGAKRTFGPHQSLGSSRY